MPQMYTLQAFLAQAGRFTESALRFDIVAVSRSGIGLGFRLRGFLGGADTTGAVVAGFFYIVFFGQRRDEGGSSGDLADALEDNFGAAVVEFDGVADFDGASGEAADVADVFQVRSEDYYREREG